MKTHQEDRKSKTLGLSFPNDRQFTEIARAIHSRTWFRDLQILMDFVKNQGRSIGEILDAGPSADPGCSYEYGKSVLIGDVPLEDNNGLAGCSVSEMYAFFASELDAYEQDVACHIQKAACINPGAPETP